MAEAKLVEREFVVNLRRASTPREESWRSRAAER
jgi:ribosomal protein L31E